MQENKQEHFIKNIEIKNFKCFEYFKAEGFGRVNLIGGKNNVGKTAFMEACFLNIHAYKNPVMTINSFLALEYLRGVNGNFAYSLKNFIAIVDNLQTLNIHSNINKFNFSFLSDSLNNKQLKVNSQTLDIKQQDYDNRLQPLFFENFIPSSGIDDGLILTLFETIKTKRKRNILNKYLNTFYVDIEEFDFLGNEPKVYLTSLKNFVHIKELGHGLKRYIAMVSTVLASEYKNIFIDEIENGIHYSKLDEIWEIILRISKEQNVQVFATTHSKECIESYARVAKKLEDEEITFIKMTRLDDSSIMAGIRDYEMLQGIMEDGHEVRGW